MASRFNTKFAFTLAVISMTVVVILGGLGFLAYRANTQKHITAGDEFMAQKDYKSALKEYGRALDKEKSDLSYLAKYEEALMKIRPATPNQAAEYYSRFLSIFNHKLRYQPAASDIHLAYLEELYAGARLMDFPAIWGELYKAANEMKMGVAQSDPNQVYSDLYIGLSITRKSTIPSSGDLKTANEHLLIFLKAMPDSDKAWAGRVQIQLSNAYRKRDEGNNVLAEELIREADGNLEQARNTVTTGPEIAKIYAARLLQRQLDGDDTITDEDVSQAIDKMVDLATASSDPLHLLDISNTIRYMDRVRGIERGIEILQVYLRDNPLGHLHRFALAELLYLADRFDDSNELSNAIIDAEPITVSLLSRYLPVLQIRAASLVVDCEFERWEKGDEDEKVSRLETMKQARERLAKQIPNPDSHPLLLRADGKVEYAHGNLHAAAEKFEQCLKLMSTRDYELLLYSAQVLELIGQDGAAISRLNDALKEKPGNLYLLRKKAGIQLKLMLLDDASETISEALRRNADDEQTKALAKIIEDARQQNSGHVVTDISKALEEARQAIDAGNHDSARSILLRAIEKNGEDDLRLLYILAVIELQTDRLDLAVDYLDRALVIQPNNQNLQVLKSTIGIDDPIERLILAIKISYPTEPKQTVMLAVELLRRADYLAKLSAKNIEDDNDEDATSQQVQLDKLRSAGQDYLTQANKLAPDHRIILDYLLTQSLYEEDWVSAEKIIERAKSANADQAQGLLFQGRYELSRKQFVQAVRTLTTATELKSYESHPWRLLGRAYESLGNNAQAQRAYSEAYERNPNDVIVVEWYVSLLERMGKNTSALRVLRSSQSLMKRSQSLKNQWLQQEAANGNLQLAIRERREMYKSQPKYLPNAMQLAALLVQTEPTYESILDEDGIARFNSDRWIRISSEQRTKMLQEISAQWLEESNSIVDAIQAQRGEVIEIVFLRASLLMAQSKIAQGDKVLLDFLQKHDESERTIEMYIAIGEYRISTNQLNSAISILVDGRKYQSADNREADTTLANMFYSRQAFKQAAKLYVELIKAKPDRSTSLRLVECYVNLRNLEQATDLLKEITDQDGPDLFSMMLESSIAGLDADMAYESEGESAANSKYDKQRNILDETIILYPGDPRPYIQKARSYLNEYRRTGKGALLNDALLTLNEADEVRSGTSATSYVRTEVLLVSGDVQGAIGELNRLIKQSPDDSRARSTLVNLYERQGNTSDALRIVSDAIERNPILVIWHVKQGELYIRQENYKAGALSYNQAFILQPTAMRLTQVAEASLLIPNTNYARLVEFIISATQELKIQGDMKLRSALARAYYGNGQLDLAIEQLSLGYENFAAGAAEQKIDINSLDKWFIAINMIFAADGPAAIEKFVNEVSANDPNAYCIDWIARAWFSLGEEGFSRAIELQQLALSKCPADQGNVRAILLINLGTYNLRRKNYELADSAFSEVLQDNPNHFIALNNAAYVKSEFLNKADEALPLAKQAKSLRPDDPNVLDTLGWIHYLLGNYNEAEDALRESVKLRESSSSIYHLASVFYKQGRLMAAQTRLIRAAELNPDPETSADIDRLDADINKAMNR